MARRSSARIRNRTSSTPKRVSLSHDASARTPRTAPVKLRALQEYEEMPGAFPGSASPPARDAHRDVPRVVSRAAYSTPPNAAHIKPAEEEMHPQQYQQSTARPLGEARWLGFSRMPPNTEPPKHNSKIATLQGTPTKAPKVSKKVDSPRFRFTFGREHSLELSPSAQKLMEDSRGMVLKIKEQMIADGDGVCNAQDVNDRKFATPKGKKGRFSEAHVQQFQKMGSIAGHASAFRADPSRTMMAKSPNAARASPCSEYVVGSTSKTLKRTASKAELEEPESAQNLEQSKPKTLLVRPPSTLPRSASAKNINNRPSPQVSSPSKRTKRADHEDVSTGLRVSRGNEATHPVTPRSSRVPVAPSNADQSTFTTPTKASLARASSIKSVTTSRIPAPAVACSLVKSVTEVKTNGSPKPSTPLLARSPFKASLFSNPHVEDPTGLMSPLLMRTPIKHSPAKQQQESEFEDELKPRKIALLSRSPLKMSTVQQPDRAMTESASTSAIPLLAKTPAKIPVPNDGGASHSEQTTTKANGSRLLGRFNLLRSSPMKSILRSPQRLYSNDPAKVAAGTHLASPADVIRSKKVEQPTPSGATPSVEKHVDFTSSTKARYERGQSETDSTPSKPSTPSVSTEKEDPKPSIATYPSLPESEAGPIVTPQKRRQTAAPGDFTFTAHGNGIVFSQSPNAPASAVSRKLPTIRHVSAEPQLPPPPPSAMGSKKRKFDFENETVTEPRDRDHTSDKENVEQQEEERPAKRVKPNAPEPSPNKPAKRLPTLGVKPKKNAKDGSDRRPSTISRARLNALAQPKRKA